MGTEKQPNYIIDGFIGQRMVYLPGMVKKRILNDPRIRDLYITHIGIFPKALGHLRKRPLGSSQYILIYCLAGKGWIEVKGIRKHLKANQMFIIPPKTPCSYGASATDPWTNYWLHFSGEHAPSYAPSLNQVIDIPPSDQARIDDRLELFEEMLQNLEDYYAQAKVVYANICLKLFLSSVNYLDVYRSAKKDMENDLVKQVISYMKKNLHRNMRVTELAETCDCSASNLYKLFKANLGNSPQDFFIHLKMERARKLLSQSSLKVKDVALKLGYDDPYYFSRIFSRYVGLSPSNYRKEEG
jgi:AraC-like DNA-binding protein